MAEFIETQNKGVESVLLVGVVIESVTGGSYFDYIRENIYELAGMKNSDCYDMDRPVKNLAIGYTRDGAAVTASEVKAPGYIAVHPL